MIGRVVLLLALVTLVINVVAFPYLPDRVGMQLGAGGLQSYIPKVFYVVLAPAVLAFVGFTSGRSERGVGLRSLAIGVIFFVVNAVILYVNLRQA